MQMQHILSHPDSYIDSVSSRDKYHWVMCGNQMQYKSVAFIPGLYKIFCEILQNAIEHNHRMDNSVNQQDRVTCIKITISNKQIVVENNGQGIDILINPVYDVYIPHLIFSFNNSHFNHEFDHRVGVASGYRGYGARICNLFSSEFIVETVDSNSRKYYKQKFSNNNSVKADPEISDDNGNSYTKITFKPDLTIFGIPDGIPEDMIKVLERQVGC